MAKGTEKEFLGKDLDSRSKALVLCQEPLEVQWGCEGLPDPQ